MARFFLLTVVALATAATGLGAVSAAADGLAVLFSAEGTVERRARGSTEWAPVTAGAPLEAGDAVRTAGGGRAAIRLDSGVLLRLNGDSALELGTTDDSVSVNRGELYLLSREPSRVPGITTPLVSAAIRGTEIVVRVRPDEVRVSVLEGSVDASNTFGSVSLTNGEEAVTVPGAAPQKRIMVSPNDAVQWAVSYPAECTTDELAGRPEPEARELARAAELLAHGDANGAVAILDRLAAGLANGEARLAAIADAQRALIQIVNDRKESAAELVRSAKERAPDSPTVLLVESYLSQSMFELADAEASAARAVAAAPKSVGARLRLAELLIGLGRTDDAEQAIEEAREIDPNDPRLLLLSGFLELIRRHHEEARALFDEAIAANSSESLAFFGRGLARVNSGDLPGGRGDFERAVSLDPRVSAYRSYLGKAYYEEDRYGVAERELARAEELDQRDPTPHLYRAYNKLASYRPVEALRSLERSITLNDNRAVYRSSLALDDDRAVRSAGLAETYVRLGFFELGRVEAYKSLNQNYGSTGAHRLLAGSTFLIPGRTLTFSREVNISRLLAPVSFNAVRPSTAADPGSNEYSALFDRPAQRTLIEGFGRTPNDTIDGVAAHAGSLGRFSYSLEHRSTYLDERGENNDRREHNPSIFLAYAPTDEDTLQLSGVGAFFNRSLGNVPYDRDLNDPDSSSDTEAYVGRAGWRHEFTPQVKLISQASTFKTLLNLRDDDRPRSEILRTVGDDLGANTQLFDESFDIRTRENTRGYRVSSQIIADTDVVSTVVGGELLKSRTTREEESGFTSEPSLDPFTSRGSGPDNAQELFGYATWHVGPRVDFTTGMGYSRLEIPNSVDAPPYAPGSATRDRFLPKVGLLLTPLDSLSLRLAYFRTFGASPTTNLDSLEPTFVAGFEQAIDDPFGATQGDHAATGIDFKVPGLAYTGVEFQRSKYNFPSRSVVTTLDVDPDFNVVGSSENSGVQFGTSDTERFRFYHYQVLSKQLVAGLTYNRNRIDDDFVASKARIHRTAASLNWFIPRGVVLFGSVNWRNERLDGFGETLDGTEGFTTCDVGASYLFPKRQGSFTVGIQNLFDRSFRYESFGIDQQPLPELVGYAKVSVNF